MKFLSIFPLGDSDPQRVPVRSVGPATAFYVQVLGFNLIERRENAAVISRDSVTLTLENNSLDPEQISFAIGVDDLDTLHRELTDKHLEPSPIKADSFDGRNYRIFFAQEPFGVCFCFTQPAD